MSALQIQRDPEAFRNYVIMLCGTLLCTNPCLTCLNIGIADGVLDNLHNDHPYLGPITSISTDGTEISRPSHIHVYHSSLVEDGMYFP